MRVCHKPRATAIVLLIFASMILSASSVSAGVLTGSAKVITRVWKGSGKALIKSRKLFKMLSSSNGAKHVVKGAISARAVAGVLSDKMIAKLSLLSVPEAARVLGTMKLSSEVLVDTYLRILVCQGKISSEYASQLWVNLKDVPGFVATMKKATSVNAAQQIGHHKFSEQR